MECVWGDRGGGRRSGGRGRWRGSKVPLQHGEVVLQLLHELQGVTVGGEGSQRLLHQLEAVLEVTQLVRKQGWRTDTHTQSQTRHSTDTCTPSQTPHSTRSAPKWDSRQRVQACTHNAHTHCGGITGVAGYQQGTTLRNTNTSALLLQLLLLPLQPVPCTHPH